MSIAQETEKIEEVSGKLLAWYDRHGRSLPWRADPQPYNVWVSEIMSQQTRIAAMLPYYQRWMQLFPDVKTLAVAQEEQVLKAWEGLGYYSRARNLQRAAHHIVAAWGGDMKGDYHSLLTLPGVGPYTAAAIASIAFGERVAAVDGNALRVLARVFGVALNIGSKEGKKEIGELLLALLPFDRPGDGNQAVMDLGSAYCLPKNPRCDECPLEMSCVAHAAGWEEKLPIKSAKKAQRVEWRAVALWQDEKGNYLLRRREERLLHGLWEFPGETLDREGAKPRWEALRKLGLQATSEKKGPQAHHVFTHICWQMQGYWLRTSSTAPLPEGYAWAPVERLADYAIPSAMRAFVQAVLAKKP